MYQIGFYKTAKFATILSLKGGKCNIVADTSSHCGIQPVLYSAKHWQMAGEINTDDNIQKYN